jgi:hypothetical protein
MAQSRRRATRAFLVSATWTAEMPTSTRESTLTPHDAAISEDSTLQLRLIWTALTFSEKGVGTA